MTKKSKLSFEDACFQWASGFYLTDHPHNEFEEIFTQFNIKTYNEFYANNAKEGLVAGTIMSIQEKKSAKGTPYAIVKFSDNVVSSSDIDLQHGGTIFSKNNGYITFAGNSTTVFRNNTADFGAAMLSLFNSSITFNGRSNILFNNNTA